MKDLLKKIPNEAVAILWAALGAFLSIALYSYYTGDPSITTMSDIVKPENLGGYVGAYSSDFLYQLFGLCSWFFVLSCFYFAYKAFVDEQGHYKTLFILPVFIISLFLICAISALHFASHKFFDENVLPGGWMGFFITSKLVHVFNPVGTGLILWTSFIVSSIICFELSISDLFSKGRYYFLIFMEQLQHVKEAAATRWASRKDEKIIAQQELDNEAKIYDYNEKRVVSAAEYEASSEVSEIAEDNEGAGLLTSSISDLLKPKKKVSTDPETFGKRKVKLKTKIKHNVENWQLPEIGLIEDPPLVRTRMEPAEIKRRAELLTNKLGQFNVKGNVKGISPGPAVTMFEFKPNADVKISKITELADDLSLALSSESVRIIAPIPGRDVVGIETSNATRETVYLKDILAEKQFWSEEISLPIALGRAADGSPKVVDLRKMPHLLVAGSTGSGKSVFTVSTLVGLICRHSPATLKLILVDPKQVDLAAFKEIPHLLVPPIREAKKALGALKWAINEMEKRYRSMSKFGARGLESFNEKVSNLDKLEFKKHEEFNEMLDGMSRLEDYYYQPQPYIVIVVEEFGDLMAVDKSNVEQAVVRLAQMARACGIHLVLAMQSPRKDVVTGLIKTNIPGRVSFKVASKMDSRIILDESGAERLLSRGDMLFLAPGVSKPARHHGPWLSDDDIDKITGFWRSQGDPEYNDLAMRGIQGNGGGFDLPGGGPGGDEEFDERYDEIIAFASGVKTVSASLLQRKFKLGYPRAARIIETMEEQGVVGPARGSKPREVLINDLK